MLNSFYSLYKKSHLIILMSLVLLCGCSTSKTSQTSSLPTPVAHPASPTPAAQQASPTPTPVAQQAYPTPTPAAQTNFTSYVGKWTVHGSLLSINANDTGLYQWNVGPCSNQGQMCNGNAQITFTENADGSITGTIQSVSYLQWNGSPAPAGFTPNVSDPQAGDTFQLQDSSPHLLYTTWLGKSSYLNSGNRYWCDPYALASGWKQCGA